MESIHGSGLIPPTTPPVRPAVPEGDGPRPGAGEVGTPIPHARPPAADAARLEREAPGGGASAAPRGVDPDLWSVLTAEEREFFAVRREMGPITYGREPRAAREAPLPRGRRLDVRA